MTSRDNKIIMGEGGWVGGWMVLGLVSAKFLPIPSPLEFGLI